MYNGRAGGTHSTGMLSCSEVSMFRFVLQLIFEDDIIYLNPRHNAYIMPLTGLEMSLSQSTLVSKGSVKLQTKDLSVRTMLY